MRQQAIHGSVACVVALVFLVGSGLAQGGAETTKTAGDLVAPVGATNPNAKGKVKTFFQDNGQKVSQRLMITAERLTRKTDYRVVVDGFDIGTFATKGKSGTLVLRFRDPAKGRQTPLAPEIEPVFEIVTVEIFDATTGELALTGTLEVVDS
jgi:hypothetical protein